MSMSVLFSFPAIIIGLIFIVQAFRGAGMATAALGAACVISAISGLVFSPNLTAISMGLCGVAVIVLAFREGRTAP